MIKTSKLFIAFFLASFLFAFLAGGTLPYYIFYSLLFILTTGYLYIVFQKHFVAAEVKVYENILKAGDESETLIMIKSNTVLPAPFILVKSLTYEQSGSGYTGEMLNITREEDCWVRNRIKFYRRGIYDLGKVDMLIKDLFHIFTLRKIEDSNCFVKVYPRVYDIDILALGGKDIYQRSINIKSNTEDIFAIKDVRKYCNGDSLKKVHWKVSAKHGELYVKNSDNILGEEFAIFLDMNKSNLSIDKNGEAEESMVDLCVSMVNYMVQKNICTKVFINSLLCDCIDVNTKENFNSLLDFFLKQSSDGEEDFAEFLYKSFYKLQRNNRIGLITTQITELLCRNISRIKSYGYTLTLFYYLEDENHADKIRYLNNMGVQCISISKLLKRLKDR
jgi:hypothetical protein